jgi:diguanylate cyclase (GGDEF)-like protein/PAS domain S-box-containing protein
VGDGPVRSQSSSTRAGVSGVAAQLGAAFLESSVAMCALDDDGRIVALNDALSALLDRGRDEIEGMSWAALSHPDDVPAEALLLGAMLARHRQRYEIDKRLGRADGTYVWCRTTATATTFGSCTTVLVEALDISEERALGERVAAAEEKVRLATTAFQEELRRLAIAATTDQGTGLKNRRGFFALAQHELNLAQRLGHPLTLIFFDLDRLKLINDTYGHLEGDRAIADTAQLLSSTFRESDLVARLGGDEFCVLALGPPAAFAQTMRRFERALDEHNRSDRKSVV